MAAPNFGPKFRSGRKFPDLGPRRGACVLLALVVPFRVRLNAIVIELNDDNFWIDRVWIDPTHCRLTAERNPVIDLWTPRGRGPRRLGPYYQ